jgi:hypothetical protein
MTEDGTEKIAPCGLYCGDCFAHQGQIADLARDLRRELRAAKFEIFAAELSKVSLFRDYEHYPEAYKVLGAMVRFRCKRGCRAGGGNPYCDMKKCNERKELTGCWECQAFEDCKKLRNLDDTHGDAHVRNLRRLKKKGPEAFVEGKREWYHKKKD